MLGPIVSHAPCALDLQRRIREARTASLSRGAGRRRRGRVERTADLVAGLGGRGEDVWSALRV
ncbi:MAG TPA: hypothetical protein VE962_04915 [Actinomycetota bacterium]|nr:hypothetical protein [Actinomycetota bacterium]